MIQLEFPDFETRPNFKAQYLEGFDAGINWDGNYIPGGPRIYSGRNTEMATTSRLEYEQWMKGFNEGLAKRLETNEHFAAWWKRNKGKQYCVNGVTIDEVRYYV